MNGRRRSGGTRERPPAACELVGRFARHLQTSGLLPEGTSVVVVALSGGLDSVVLLHLLHFGPRGPEPSAVAAASSPSIPRMRLAAAHFDHRMRGGSEADASWVRGLAAAWGIPLHEGCAPEPPAGEAQARTLRYAFLEEARRAAGAHLVVTAHHADDQAETVLFRVVRGTGVAGLGGIPERRGAFVRPLLPFWREELQAYARAVGLQAREDPSNRDLRYARNVLRRRILPMLEADVASGARRALVRLARHARREEAAWRSLLPPLLDGIVESASDRRIVVVRSRLLGYDSTVRGRLVRELVERLGGALDESGTRAALEFTSSGASGRRRFLPGGVILSRAFDRLILSRRGSGLADVDRLLEIPEAGPGGGTLVVRGRRNSVTWSLAHPPRGTWSESFSPRRLTFPLLWRTWSPGDRVRLPYGSKKLKKVLTEGRVPVDERRSIPVLVDGRGRVLWVPGVVRSVDARPEPGEEALHVAVTEEGREW